MKEVINIKNEYNESDEIIQQDADVYSFVDSEVFTASGGYQVIRSTFVRDRDQKVFEARNRMDGKPPQKMVLLERNDSKPPHYVLSVAMRQHVKGKEWIDLREKLTIRDYDLDTLRLLLADEGYKIVKDGREKESKTKETDTP